MSGASGSPDSVQAPHEPAFHVKHEGPAAPTPWLHAQQQLETYANQLTTVGAERGLIGPRETDRIWPRHILNCAVVATDPCIELPNGAAVVDVGSGAGLPGIVWALVRPDLRLILIESMRRRATFLEETVDLLGISDRVAVVCARAEDVSTEHRGDVVTARAVAPLAKLAKWCLPLVENDGRFLALKGRTAADELESARAALRRAGATSVELVTAGGQWLAEPTRVIVARKGRDE